MFTKEYNFGNKKSPINGAFLIMIEMYYPSLSLTAAPQITIPNKILLIKSARL